MDKEEKIELYLKGYEEGQKEAWSNIKSMASRYEGWELKSRIESKLGTLYQNLDAKRAELKEDPQELILEDEESGGEEAVEVGGEEELAAEEESVEEEGMEDKTAERKDWKRGCSYLLWEKNPDSGITSFKDLVEEGNKGLCISREYPEKIINRYELPKDEIQFVQLSKSSMGYSSSEEIRWSRKSPANLSSLSAKIGGFLRDNEGVVFMHGVPNLLFYNTFNKVLDFLSWAKDKIQNRNAYLLISVDESALEEDQVNILRGEFDYNISGD